MQPKISSEKAIQLPGWIHKFGANSEGLVYAMVMIQPDKERRYQLLGIAIAEGIQWQLAEEFNKRSDLRIANSGEVWVSSGSAILNISPAGEILNTLEFELADNQQIGSFVLMEDGFLVCVEGKREPNSKVLRSDANGAIRWETKIPAGKIAYEGIIQMTAKKNWEPEQKPDWNPINWITLDNNEIFVSNGTALVSYFEMPRSGIGVSYCLDVETGQIKWITPPKPYESIACIGNGLYLMAYQGYGAFETKLWSQKGEVIDKWESAGRAVLSPEGDISSIQMSNDSRRMHFVNLKGNGIVALGPVIDGYWMTYPAIDEWGNMVFWRNRELVIIDNEQKVNIFRKEEPDAEDIPSERILIVGEGTVVFSVNTELFILETSLGRLANSIWPCAFGNNERNPFLD